MVRRIKRESWRRLHPRPNRPPFGYCLDGCGNKVVSPRRVCEACLRRVRRECTARWRKRRKQQRSIDHKSYRGATLVRICDICDTEFIKVTSNERRCSKRCRLKAKALQVEKYRIARDLKLGPRKCIECGAGFSRLCAQFKGSGNKSNSRRLTCSERCRRRRYNRIHKQRSTIWWRLPDVRERAKIRQRVISKSMSPAQHRRVNERAKVSEYRRKFGDNKTTREILSALWAWRLYKRPDQDPDSSKRERVLNMSVWS